MTQLRLSYGITKSNRPSSRPDDWRDRALCRRVQPEAFFPAESDADTTREAKEACQWCPVLDECAAFADTLKPSDGVWAGKLWVNGQPVDRDARRMQPSVPEKPVPACGTEQGYQAHRYRKTTQCAPCKAAHVIAQAEWERAKLRRDVAAAKAVLAEVAGAKTHGVAIYSV